MTTKLIEKLQFVALLIFIAFSSPAFAAPIVINETGPGCELKGVWAPGGNYSTQGCVGNDYHYTSRYAPYAKTGREKAIFTPNIPAAGKYKVEVAWRGTENRSAKVVYEVTHRGGKTSKTINQRTSGASWATLGEFDFDAGTAGNVALVSDGGGSASVDAARFTPVAGGHPTGESGGTQSGMDDVLGGTSGGVSSGEAVRLEASSPGTKTYECDSDATVVVTPYLETYGRARILVKIKSASGDEREWMKWERANDKDPSPLVVDGSLVPASMNGSPSDPSPAEPAGYEYQARKGDSIILTLEGKFGRANPRLSLEKK